MRTLPTRRVCTAIVAVLAVVVLVSTAAAAAPRITAPTESPYHVALDAHGKPVSFTIVAAGYPVGHQVFVEQCNGLAPSAPNWSPNLDCDVGGAPAPVIVDAHGVARFPAGDPNHGFQPVLGQSPSSLFNCVTSGGTAPSNGLTSYRTCQVRVSTNNTQPTSDQVFLSMVFGRGSGASSSSSSSHFGWFVGIVLVAAGTVAALVWLRARRPAKRRRRRN